MLDPAADRLYIAATVVALAIRSIIPWWLVGLLAARELLLGVVLLVLRRHDYEPLQVSFVGKAATLALFYAFPLLFLGAHPASYAEVARVAGWAFAIWGTALYWCAALLYVEQARRLIRPEHAGGSGGIAPQGPAATAVPDATAARRPERMASAGGPGGLPPGRSGRLGSGEGCGDGGRRGHPAAADDR